MEINNEPPYPKIAMDFFCEEMIPSMVKEEKISVKRAK